MGSHGTIGKWKRAATRILNLAARPVRTAHGKRGIVLQPYRGYGSREEVFLIGRVFRQSHTGRRRRGRSGGHLRDIGRRIVRRSVADATVRARFGDAEQRAVTDRDGYFRIHLKVRELAPSRDCSHDMDLVLDQLGARSTRHGAGLHPAGALPPCRDQRHRRHRHVHRRRQQAEDDVAAVRPGRGKPRRLPRGGRALPGDACRRCRADERNPMLYVSRAPWGIYDVLEEFFQIHGIPVGPMLFLREWGITWKRPLPRKAEDHKRELIGNMLALYKDLPFVLIGDSGQHDPEVYRRIVESIRAGCRRSISATFPAIRRGSGDRGAGEGGDGGRQQHGAGGGQPCHGRACRGTWPDRPGRSRQGARGTQRGGGHRQQGTDTHRREGDLREAVMNDEGGAAGEAPNVIVGTERKLPLRPR